MRTHNAATPGTGPAAAARSGAPPVRLPRFELFVSCPPGLEPQLLDEVHDRGWSAARQAPGGVGFSGSWPDIWRANLLLRGASRVLVRLGRFRAQHPGELEARSADLPWAEFLAEGQGFTVDATCRKSKIYHSGAAAERVAKAAARATGAVPGEGLRVLVRIENNLVTISADSSGELLHKRGFKEDVAGAPLRETMAALFLRAAGYRGGEAVLDPMCGSGTIVLEAAEIAAGLAPGRARRFAFEDYASFSDEAFRRVRSKACGTGATGLRFHGSDRAPGAVEASRANARRAGVGELCSFSVGTVAELRRPTGRPGLVFTNPPYGRRIGDQANPAALYRAFGQVMRERFAGWRVAMVTSDDGLANAAGLAWQQPGPWVPHGGLKVRLWQAGPLA